MRKKVVFVLNVDWFYLSHFSHLGKLANSKGHDVYLLSSDTGRRREVESQGITFLDVGFNRSYGSIISELRSIFLLFLYLRKIQPDVVEFITIKPVLYGCLISRLLNIPSVVAYISGLGYVFGERNSRGLLKRFLRYIIYPFAMKTKGLRVVCENCEDAKIISQLGGYPIENIKLLAGVGVDLETYFPSKYSSKPFVVIMVARLLKDKGVLEFIEASRALGKLGMEMKFQLVGEIDPFNPMSLTEFELSTFKNEGIVEFLGHRRDIPSLLQKATIFVLPSYREGFPKVVMEAAACGLPSIVTDVAGCRDAVVDGKTGLLVSAKSSADLAAAIKKLYDNESLLVELSRNAREHAIRQFDVNAITAGHMDFLFD